jgi:hypothetical protein
VTLPLFDDLEPRPVAGKLPPVAPRVPYQPTSETSQQGAQKAAQTAAAQCQRLLRAYKDFGPMTDAEAAFALNLERTTVIPRRHALQRGGLVVELDTRVNPKSGVRNTVYGLTKGQVND